MQINIPPPVNPLHSQLLYRLHYGGHFPTFYGNPGMSAVFKWAQHLFPYSHMNPVHGLPSCFIKIKFDIILPPTLRSSKWFFPFIISRQNPACGWKQPTVGVPQASVLGEGPTTPRHKNSALYNSRLIRYLPYHPVPWRCILIYHLLLGLLTGIFPSGFPTKTLYVFPFLSIRAKCPAHCILFDFKTLKTLYLVTE